MNLSELPLETLLDRADSYLVQARAARKSWAELVREADAAHQRADDEAMRMAQTAADSALRKSEYALTEAMNLLEPELRAREAHLSLGAHTMGASEDRRQLARRLAECYGPLGGIARRKGNYRQAVELYEKGGNLERSSSYGVTGTYNRVQSIACQILENPSSISNSGGMLSRDANDLLAEIRKNETRDAWASADVYLLATLFGQRRVEREEWIRLTQLKPIRDVYESGLLVLMELHRVLPHNDLLKKAIENYNLRLPANARRSS